MPRRKPWDKSAPAKVLVDFQSHSDDKDDKPKESFLVKLQNSIKQLEQKSKTTLTLTKSIFYQDLKDNKAELSKITIDDIV